MLALLSSLLGALGQVFLKFGVKNSLIESIKAPPVWAGAVFYGVAFLLWLEALRLNPLSKLYPYLALNFVFVPLFGLLFLRERITALNAVGYFLCIAGMLLATR
ncbi:EamA family transporter [Fervidicola ferrireducens]|uniref:EamA family transporter n=1 Tax=Fervidicola ferrireducens TaxID=520764 RepID=UPI001FDFAE7C|nr:EamA family transporter [Fervidicola ferrireducens]